ncbi:unnamed protein product, partial [marine sediment metagenome]
MNEKELLLQAIAGSEADYTEIRIDHEVRNQVQFQKDKLENLESSSELGGIVRCLKEGGWGIAVLNDISQLRQK